MLSRRQIATFPNVAPRTNVVPAFPRTVLSVALLLSIAACGVGGEEGLPSTDSLQGIGDPLSAGAERPSGVEPTAGAASPDATMTPDGAVTPDADPFAPTSSEGNGGTPDTTTPDATEVATRTPDNAGVAGSTPDAVPVVDPGSVDPSSPSPVQDDPTALDLIGAHPDLGQLARAVRATDLVGYLSTPGERTTLFAPSDAAFEALSTRQREALLADPERLARLLRNGLVDGRVVTKSSAGLGLDLDSIGGSRLLVTLADDVIRLEHHTPYGTGKLADVSTSELSADAAIHVVDDIHFFTNLYRYDANSGSIESELFEPDPGSVAEALEATPSYARFTEVLRQEPRLYSELGNVERDWTVLVPPATLIRTTDVTRFRIADHVVENLDLGTAGGVFALRPGDAVTASGNRLSVVPAGEGLRVNGVDLTTIGALSVAGGTVHEVDYVVPPVDDSGAPVGTDNVLALLDRMGASEQHYYSGDEGGNQVDPSTPYRFFAALVRASGLETEYGDPTVRRTVLVPSVGIAREEIVSRFDSGLPAYAAHELSQRVSPWATEGSWEESYCHVYPGECQLYGWNYDYGNERYTPWSSWPGVFRAWQTHDGTPPAIVPNIFPDVESARAFLRAHTLEARLTTEILEENVGAVLRTMDDGLLPIGRTDLGYEGGDWPTLGGEDLQGSPMAAFNGSVVRIRHALAPTPDVFGVADFRDPSDGSWIGGDNGIEDDDGIGNEPVALRGAAGSTFAAIAADDDLSSFTAVIEDSNLRLSLEDAYNNNFVVFAPTNATIELAFEDARVYVHVRDSGVGPLTEDGEYSGVFPGPGSFTVTGTGAGETLMVNGLPATYIETESGGALIKYGY